MLARSPLLASPRPQSAAAGFTLIETIVVVVLLGMLAVSMQPKAFNTSSLTLDVQTRNLASHLQRAQLLAVTSGTPVLFCTTASGAVGSPGYLIALGVACPASITSTPVSTSYPVVVALENQAYFSVTTSPLGFNSLGRPSAAGDLRLRAAGSTLELQVTADPLSGLIRLVKP